MLPSSPISISIVSVPASFFPSICEGLRNQIYLGNDRFAQKVSRGMTGRGDLREVPRAQRRFFSENSWELREGIRWIGARRWPNPIFPNCSPFPHTLRYGQSCCSARVKNSEPSRDRMETAKHLHCRISRPDPVLRSIRERYRRISRPGTGYRPRSPRQPTGTGPTERICPRRGPVSDRPITARPVRRYIAH